MFETACSCAISITISFVENYYAYCAPLPDGVEASHENLNSWPGRVEASRYLAKNINSGQNIVINEPLVQLLLAFCHT